MKILLPILVRCYRLIIELLFILSRPLLWLILPLYRYKQTLEPEALVSGNPILVHCASVGEVNAIAPLLRHFMKTGIPIMINTVTVTGRDLVSRSFPEIPVRLAPLDIASQREKSLRTVAPRLILIVETEIWPMLLDSAGRLGIPVVFINARMSDKSYAAYSHIGPVLRYLARSVKLVLAQSEEDRQRFENLLRMDAETAGNLKYCLSLPDYSPTEVRTALGFAESDLILVWGSSRPGEEALMMSLLPGLKNAFNNLKLILAPRHPKRCIEVERILHGTTYRKLSDKATHNSPDVLLIDGLGHLSEAYAIADLAVVGGSFYDFGGHNPLEPAFYSKAIVIGKHYHSCKASVNKLRDQSAVVVSDKDCLGTDIAMLLKDEALRHEMGRRAKRVLTENADALENHIKGIEKCLR
jgi:3-deoxy-D-manno-octulosonic-acid transferase